jgi:tetratricopeptide (TPR) repeat protein
MNLRMGVILAAALLALGGCASSSGSGGGATAAPSVPQGETLEQGERERENAETRAAESALDAAESAEEAGDEAAAMASYNEAIANAEAAVAADPTNPLAHRLLALAYMGVDNYVKADSALSRAEELRPIYQLETDRIREQEWVQLYQSAAPMVNAGDYAGAAEIFEQADAIYDKRPEVKAFLGQIYVQLGENEKAIPYLRGAVEVIEGEEGQQMMQRDSAVYAQWVQTGEQLPVYLAQALMGAQRYDEAVGEMKMLLEEDPENPRYLSQLSSLYMRLEQPDSARAVYEDMLAMETLGAQDYYSVGVGLYQMEDYEAAADAFGQAVEAAVNDRDAIEMQARSLQLAYPSGEDAPTPPEGALERLEAAATRWMELDPANRNAYLVLAQTESRLDKGAEAGALVQQIEEMPFFVNNMQLRRYPDSGGMVTGQLVNQNLEAGASVTLRFTFFDAQGNEIGSHELSAEMQEPEASQPFQFEFETTAPVDGYTYEVVN